MQPVAPVVDPQTRDLMAPGIPADSAATFDDSNLEPPAPRQPVSGPKSSRTGPEDHDRWT